MKLPTLLFAEKQAKKINVIGRLMNYPKLDQRNLQLYSAIKSQFTYYPLIWMFTSLYPNNELNNIHERALRLL